MSKYSERFKLRVVQKYLSGTDGFTVIANENGVPRTLLRRWIELFRAHGTKGLRKKFTHYTAEFKLSVLKHMWDNGLSRGQATAAFNLRSPAVIGDWERKYRDGGVDGLRSRPRGRPKMTGPTKPPPADKGAPRTREEELQAENDRLRMENEYLKKLRALVLAQKKPASAKKRK